MSGLHAYARHLAERAGIDEPAARRVVDVLCSETAAELRKQHQHEKGSTAAWLSGQRDVSARRTTSIAPEQWEGSVDGHSFYFRERHGFWRIELAGNVVAEGVGAQLGTTPAEHLAFIVQQMVPDAVLVGGSAAALYAGHRDSYDHDHVLGDLQDRFDVVLEALESEGEWVTNRVVPGKVILGRLGDIEAGVRQMIRTQPLETTQVTLPSGGVLKVPTAAETLRVKGFLIVRRNQTRDYLDVAALADRYGIHEAAGILARIDNYYADQHGAGRGIAAQLVRQLADPRPKDSSVTKQLGAYRNLDTRWTDWGEVRSVCGRLAAEMLEAAV